MNAFACPKLKNRRTGAEIELNANPFSIGRGLSCNYVLPSKTVSRVHCILEMTNNVWVLKDTSTNGTFVNGKLVKHVTSPPLKDSDVISLEINGVDSYLFVNEEVTHDDISDEQLCAIADNVLNEMEHLTSNPVSSSGDQQGAASLPPPTDAPDSTVNPLLDHMYTSKSSGEPAKKPRMGRSPRPILGSGGRTNAETTPHLSQEGGTCSYDEASLLGTMDLEPYCSNVICISDSTGVSRNPSSESLISPVRSVTNSSRSTETLQDDAGRTDDAGRADDAVSSSQNNDLLPGFSEGTVASSDQPGPSTDKTEKPPEQPDSYEVVENELQCVICSELFIKALTLNCSHTFCKYCIGMWSKNKSDCPICRTKITSTTATIVLDNVIEKVIENSNEEIKHHRQTILEERKKQDEAENKSLVEPKQEQRQAGRGRGRGRGATARRARGGRGNRAQDAAPRINVLDPVAINIGALVNNNVIEVSSDSDWSSDTESMSPTDLQDEYDADDWYDGRRSYWGGYGYCYRCGSPTHWANSCPNR